MPWTADQYNNVAYRTIIKCEDSVVRERTGLKFYGVPIGNQVHLVVSSCNPHY